MENTRYIFGDWWQNTDTSHEEGYLTDLVTDQALNFISPKPFLQLRNFRFLVEMTRQIVCLEKI